MAVSTTRDSSTTHAPPLFNEPVTAVPVLGPRHPLRAALNDINEHGLDVVSACGSTQIPERRYHEIDAESDAEIMAGIGQVRTIAAHCRASGLANLAIALDVAADRIAHGLALDAEETTCVVAIRSHVTQADHHGREIVRETGRLLSRRSGGRG